MVDPLGKWDRTGPPSAGRPAGAASRGSRPPPRAGPYPVQAAIWADESMTLIRGEMRVAVPIGVISTGKSEQLLARLNLVVDQALTTR